jgi:hypothetical protein
MIKAIAVAGNLASPVRTESYEISPRADTLLVPGGNFTPGGGYSFQHPGLTQSAARIVLAPPDTVVVKGFQDIPFAMILSSAVESDPFPRIVFTKPATDKKALYRIGKDGRPLFISDADSVAIPDPGVYFLGIDTLPPVVQYLGESYVAGDSTRARFRIDDNVANILYSLQRSDNPNLNISQRAMLTPDTVTPTLKNKEGNLAPLWLIITLGDHRNAVRFPADGNPWFLCVKVGPCLIGRSSGPHVTRRRTALSRTRPPSPN